MEEYQILSRITLNPDIMVGKPVIRNLRITVEQLLRSLAGGAGEHDILEDYPELEPEDIRAALLFAADLVNERREYPDNE